MGNIYKKDEYKNLTVNLTASLFDKSLCETPSAAGDPG